MRLECSAAHDPSQNIKFVSLSLIVIVAIWIARLSSHFSTLFSVSLIATPKRWRSYQPLTSSISVSVRPCSLLLQSGERVFGHRCRLGEVARCLCSLTLPVCCRCGTCASLHLCTLRTSFLACPSHSVIPRTQQVVSLLSSVVFTVLACLGALSNHAAPVVSLAPLTNARSNGACC